MFISLGLIWINNPIGNRMRPNVIQIYPFQKFELDIGNSISLFILVSVLAIFAQKWLGKNISTGRSTSFKM